MRRQQRGQRSRPLWLVHLMLTGAVLLVAACGGREPETTEERETRTATRTVTTPAGQVEIPANPQRIVALWPATLGALVQLSFRPVGAVGDPQVHDGALGAHVPEDYPLQEVTVIAAPGDLQLPEVANLQPDLILGVDTEPLVRHRAELADIAPTALLPWQGPSSWRQHVADVAAALGAEAEAEQADAAYEERVQEVRARLGQQAAQTTVSLVRLETPEEVLLATSRSFSGQVLADLGLEPAVQRGGDGVYLPVDHEQLATVDGDVLFVMHDDSQEQAEAAVAAATGSPQWGQLSAVQSDQDVDVDYGHWGAPSYAAAHRVLDDIEAGFTGGQPHPLEPA